MTRDQCIALMIDLEGGEANVKGDPGGHTKYGITQATLDTVRQSFGYNSGLPTNVSDLTSSQATVIYERTDWVTINGDNLPSTLAPLMLNTAVNMGETRAIRLLQEALGLSETQGFKGVYVVGPSTLRAIAAWRSPYGHGQTFPEEYAAHVAARYAKLDTAEDQFELGWFRRLFRVYTLAVLTP